MKKVMFILMLIVISLFQRPAYSTGLLDLENAANYLINDIKANSRFGLDSVIPMSNNDWRTGEWFVGTALPFAQVGSFLYFAGAWSHSIVGDSQEYCSLNTGLRLNSITRPAVKFVLEKIPGLKDRVRVIDTLSQALSIGVHGGHDFKLDGREKIIVNRIGLYFGFEIGIGPEAQASVESRRMNRVTSSPSMFSRLYLK